MTTAPRKIASPLKADGRGLDVAALCRSGERVEGRWPVVGLDRLLSGTLPPAEGAEAAWSVQGRLVPVTGGEPEVWVRLVVEAPVVLQCQRCLQAVDEVLTVDRDFRFVASEDEAEALDEDSEVDVLVLAPRLDVIDWVEDELILAQPIVPMHEVCPEPLPVPEDDLPEADDKPNPFAVLAQLRKNGGQG